MGLDCSVTIDVVHVKRPLELLFGSTGGCDVDCLEKLLEVDFSTVIRVKGSENVFAELVSVALREETRIDLKEFVSRQLTIRTVSLKTINTVTNLRQILYSLYHAS